MLDKKDKLKELQDIVNISEKQFEKLDYKGKQRYFKAKSKLAKISFISRDKNGKGITYVKPLIPNSIQKELKGGK